MGSNPIRNTKNKNIVELRRCSKCEIDKPLSGFTRNKAKKCGYNSYCKECNKDYQKKHYEDNKLNYIDKKNNRKNVLKEHINSIKLKNKCSRCSEDDIACLDFHHIDDKDKDFNIGEAVKRGISIDKINNEIDKCLVLCSNCHRKLHYYE